MVPFQFGTDFVCHKKALAGGGSDTIDMTLSAPVGASASRVLNRASDVRKVQTALNRFSARDGGPDPVLVVDGICGPLTKAAIVNFQITFSITPKGSRTPDGIVDLVGETVDRLSKGPNRVIDGAAEFFERIPDVMRVVTAASAAMEAAIFQLQFGDNRGGIPSLNLFGKAAADRADRHFKINKTIDPIARLRQVQSIYRGMQTAIGHVPQGTFLAVDEPPDVHIPAFAFTGAGGFFIRDPNARFDGSGLPVNSIYITPLGRSLATDGFTYTMIHELAHFVGPETPDKPGDPDLAIEDFGAFHLGTIDRLSPDQRLRNADSYAQFAFDAIGKRNFNIRTGNATP